MTLLPTRMLYLPSPRIQELLKVEQAGVWLDRSSTASELWMVAKMPMNVIRAINAGASVALCAWVVEIDNFGVAVFGLRVDDNPEHPTLCYGACRSTAQLEDLRGLLTAATFPLQVHNEIFLPILHATCRIVPELARPVIDRLPLVGDYPEPQGRSLRSRALDLVADVLMSQRTFDSGIKAKCTLTLEFERTESLSTFVADSGVFSLEDNGEGTELERLGFQAFDYLCPFGTVHQPLVEYGRKRRELCDILAVSRVRENENEGVFVVESKVASETPEGLKRTNTRRAASIKKNIMSAIGQLKGAVKRIQAGDQVFHPDGTPFGVDPPNSALEKTVEPLNLQERANKVGHAIVLVSDMHEGVDWQKVAEQLLKSMESTKYFFHVLDLRELQRLVSHSQGRPALFEGFLVRRWQIMAQRRSALMRFQFVE